MLIFFFQLLEHEYPQINIFKVNYFVRLKSLFERNSPVKRLLFFYKLCEKYMFIFKCTYKYNIWKRILVEDQSLLNKNDPKIKLLPM